VIPGIFGITAPLFHAPPRHVLNREPTATRFPMDSVAAAVRATNFQLFASARCCTTGPEVTCAHHLLFPTVTHAKPPNPFAFPFAFIGARSTDPAQDEEPSESPANQVLYPRRTRSRTAGRHLTREKQGGRYGLGVCCCLAPRPHTRVCHPLRPPLVSQRLTLHLKRARAGGRAPLVATRSGALRACARSPRLACSLMTHRLLRVAKYSLQENP
jgi:hypothetical protein